MHSHIDPHDWSDIMPQIVHVHAKFYDIDSDGAEPSLDYPELVKVSFGAGTRDSFPPSGRGMHSPTGRGRPG